MMRAESDLRSSDRWLAELASKGAVVDAAVADLRQYLHRSLGSALAGRGVSEADLDDFAQEAVVRVLGSLASFRGESRFTTWATAVAVRVALSALRRRRYRESRERIDSELVERAASDKPDRSRYDAESHRHELLTALRTAIDESLSERQRQAVLGELAGTPSTVLAETMGMTRNALYKLHYDARKKLRAALMTAGFDCEQVRQALHEASED